MFGSFSLDKQHIVKIFLIGKGVEYEEINDKNFNIKELVKNFLGAGGKFLLRNLP